MAAWRAFIKACFLAIARLTSVGLREGWRFLFLSALRLEAFD